MITINNNKYKDKDFVGFSDYDDHYDFWVTLKEGYDYFETTRLAPTVAVCEKRYLVNANFVGGARPSATGACPAYRKGQVVAFKPSPQTGDKTMSQASLAKPLGAVMGLSFGAITPTYRAMTLGPATPSVAPAKKK